MSPNRPLNKLSELLLRQLRYRLNDEEHAFLKEWLAEDEEARQYYVEFVALNAQLRKQRIAFDAPENQESELSEGAPNCAETFAGLFEETIRDSHVQASEPSPEDVDKVRQIAEKRLQAFLAEQEQSRRQQALYQRDRTSSVLKENLTHIAERISATATWTLRNAARLSALAAIALLGLAIVQYTLNHRIVATLDETVHAQWDAPLTDANLHPGPMFLEEGFAKLTFRQGAEVILQAPCAFDLSSKNKMILHRGMVTAQVPPEAHGFAIKTPQSTVTDFGTEFGVLVQESAASEVHVFDGRVQVKTVPHPHQQPQNCDITKGKAASLTESGELNIGSLGAHPKLFVRDIPEPNSFSIPNKRLDLADIVGGGTGFGTGSRYACINPATGQTGPMYRSERRMGENAYVKVASLPYVDGVFVPLAEGGLMPVSTAGHHFDFPSGGGSWFVELANGGIEDNHDLPHRDLILDRQNYGTVTHPALIMHASLGITFDLDAIRASLTGSRIKRFTSVCGISNNVQKTQTPDAIFYVLVDGQVRLYKKFALPVDLAIPIHIELRENERFLTLVCMAGTKNLGDWSFFGAPALELEGK
ncbi:FecR domain-containing protein [Planctomycetota bacterium]